MLCHVTIGGFRRDIRFVVLCSVRGFVTWSIVFTVVLLWTFFGSKSCELLLCYEYALEQSFSDCGADTPWGYQAHICTFQQLFQTVVCGCYFNFESTEVNLVYMTDTGYVIVIYIVTSMTVC